jgi:type IV pilus assembly protein PilB
MTKNIQSIEDLISGEEAADDDESALAQFSKKTKEIRAKEIEKITEKNAAAAGLGYVNLTGFPISPEALVLVSETEAKKFKAVCFFYDGTNLRLGSPDPENEDVKELFARLNAQYFTQGKLYLISSDSLKRALALYKNLPKVTKIVKGVEITEEEVKKFEPAIKDYRSLNEHIKKVNMSEMIALILSAALKTGASDIHIEAEESDIIVRLRIDGVLQEAASISRDKWVKVIARLKLLSQVKINVFGKPQDGRFTIYFSEEKIEVRVSFLPTSFGESVVMRLLRSSSIGVAFEGLGLMPQARKILESEIKKPNGMILTTGPTGSGKTTTLYAVLNLLNQPGVKIVTLEDPIEYQLKGINQSQVDPSKKYTFANGLRSILRQDPDVVMVGEIRDLETADIAVQASLTGHLVLSTLHTNDASGVIPRLVDMGVKPYFLAPSINAVIGQRLVRKLCDSCKIEQSLSEEDEALLRKILAVISPKSSVEVPNVLPKFYQAGKGCSVCGGIGYKGRIGIYEIFTMSDEMKKLVSDNTPAFKILEQAIENGMITMLQDGVLKAMSGLTSLEEVYRVIGKFDYVNTLYDIVVSQTIGHGVKLSAEVMAKAEGMVKDLSQIGENIKNSPMAEMTNIILAAAIKSSAGDIHIEPAEGAVNIRFRIDGILHDIVRLGEDHYLQLLSQMKILAGFPTNVKKATWDGRFAIFIDKNKMDCRVSIISGGYGETVVIRLLSSQASSLKLDDLGMRNYALKPLGRSISSTKGIVITTGPTGSGKTTTLYSILNKLNKPDVKIITIEDPIEYHLEGVMQTQIDLDKGYTFAAAMRSLLRQNPNIIMVGEIRDEETAKIAVEASMTGHLVLSTIHANSAAGAISRFSGLGIERQLLASAIECSVGQRLVRRICQSCKEELKLDESQLVEVKQILGQINQKSGVIIPTEFKFYHGRGCEACNGLGYKGRLGLYEVIDMSPEMQKLIQGATVTDYDIEQLALNSGSILMMQDGILKALEGETSVEEVFRVAR